MKLTTRGAARAPHSALFIAPSERGDERRAQLMKRVARY